MRKLLILVVVLFVSINMVYAQDSEWQPNSAKSVEYNCAALETLLSALDASNAKSVTDTANAIIARTKSGDELTVTDYLGAATLALFGSNPNAQLTADVILADASDACSNAITTTVASSSEPVDEFNVIANGSVNLRSCSGTECGIVRVTKDKELLTVIGIDGDWYEVKVDNGTAFISSQLTTRGPDEVINITEGYFDAENSCFIIGDPKRGDMDVSIIISGEKQDDLLVDIYRPNETRPLKVEAQLDKTFTDTGDLYILQYYAYNVSWPLNGLYQLEYTLDGTTKKVAWEFDTRAEYNIFVQCD